MREESAVAFGGVDGFAYGEDVFDERIADLLVVGKAVRKDDRWGFCECFKKFTKRSLMCDTIASGCDARSRLDL